VHIVLDLQACQSPESRRRGIGRYSLALAKAMAREPRGHDITVLLNGAMGDSIEFLRGQFDDLLPQARLVTWEALAPTAFVYPDNRFRLRASEVLRLHALRRLKPDVVHVASLFEGLADEVIATVPAGETHLTAVTLYDLIPLVHQKTYLRDLHISDWYAERITHLRHADPLLGISKFSCNEAMELLDIPHERLANISGAADDTFVRLDGAERFRGELMHRYGLHRPFIMYAGGFDSRKNIGALVRAFALLPVGLRRAHQLVIVGGAPEPERAALTTLIAKVGLVDDEVVFAGYVPDEDLVKFYNLCALYVFPSLHEGFGLPALEAMSSGAIVIGSNTSSLPEVIGCTDALFDPRSDQAIAEKMVSALTDGGFRSRLREHAEAQCRKFSWAESARRAIEAFEAAAERRGRDRAVALPVQRFKESATTAFLPAPHSAAASLLPCSAVIYADSDCTGITAERSLADFIHDRDSIEFDQIVIELANETYCARTLTLAASGTVDIVLRDHDFGIALQALAVSSEGRALVISLLYASGGYRAVRVALDGGLTDQLLGELVIPCSLNTLGQSQALPFEALAAKVNPDGCAWRDNVRGAIAELVDAEQVSAATAQDWSRTAAALATNAAVPNDGAQWLVDISNLAVRDAGTGIQRVVRHVLDELIDSPPPGYRVEPIHLGDDGVFRYARSYCARRYFEGEQFPADEPVEFAQGDVYLGLDLVAHLIPAHIQVFRQMRNRGVRQYFVLYDLLPVLRPDCFEPHLLPLFRRWYEAVAEVADGIICISRAVADEFESWLHQARPCRERALGIGWFHLGADLSAATAACAANVPMDPGLPELGDRPTFLMVGTIEPRKGHAQALAAFEQLWQQGLQVNLLVIGRPGWLVDSLLKRIADHPQRGKRLFWFEEADDNVLLAAYHHASALIMASEGEGFGLPLIEAAHHGLPLVARDLPVFREIAGEHAHYFAGYDAGDLSDALQAWLELDARGRAPQSSGMCWNTWKEAVLQLVDTIRDERWVYRWKPAAVRRFGAFDYRFHSQVGRLERGRMVATGEAGLLLYGPYVPLNAGHYTILIHGGGSGRASMDACSAGGAKIHVYQDFVADHVRAAAVLISVGLKLDADVTDLEIRVRIGEGADLWLGQIEIHPLASPAVTADKSLPDGSVIV